MTAVPEFPPFVAPQAAGPEALVLRLDGFEGPLDLLLELARAQKLDLAGISIVALVDQFLAVVEGARRVRLELAADWLVMAAWLAWLKSRLLLPEDSPEAEEGEIAADALAAQLLALEKMRAAAAWLGRRPVLGQEVFARGAPEDFTETDRSRLLVDQGGLMRSYLAAMRRAGGQRRYRPAPVRFWSVQDALDRLMRLVGQLPSDGSLWASLHRCLPEHTMDPHQRRAAVASTLLAGLEMARGGAIHLHQEAVFGPIMLRAADV